MDEKRNAIPEEILWLMGLGDDKTRNRRFFSELTKFVDRANMTDSQVYNAIGLNRTLWYRMRDNPDARTKKANILKLVVVLRLNYWEAYYIVALAGYSFIPGNDVTDRIIALCLQTQEYDPMKIDDLLCNAGADTLFTEK